MARCPDINRAPIYDRSYGLTQLITWNVFSKSWTILIYFLPDPPNYHGQEGNNYCIMWLVSSQDLILGLELTENTKEIQSGVLI